MPKPTLPEGRELRWAKIELRAYDPSLDASGDDWQRAKVGGLAARFNSPAVIAGYFVEKIAPGAFTNAIQRCDVRALFNHDENLVLARNTAGTLDLAETQDGLGWECDPDNRISYVNDLRLAIRRGDVSQCSFQFQPIRQEWDYSGDMPVRTLLECDLYDVSAVTFPAYDDTSVALRTLQHAQEADRVPVVSSAQAARLLRKRQFLDRLAGPAA